MKPPTYRGKPSEGHVIWRRMGAGAESAKRFDEQALRDWCSAQGIDFETGKRVDHDRSDEPREQYRCVFAWADEESESFDLGGEEWEIATQETPRTFVEIDSEGQARIKSWEEEYVLDIEELWLEASSLCFRAVELDGPKGLAAEKLRTDPE